jgi:hypothetical protein
LKEKKEFSNDKVLEDEADKFASDLLIPAEKNEQLKNLTSEESIKSFVWFLLRSFDYANSFSIFCLISYLTFKELKQPHGIIFLCCNLTRAELIDPKLRANGWGVVEGSKILRERNVCKITDGRIQVGGNRKKPLIADYILVYKGVKLAVVEAKSDELEVGEGVAQAKLYAQKLNLETTYSTNGNEIYQICLKTGKSRKRIKGLIG